MYWVFNAINSWEVSVIIHLFLFFRIFKGSLDQYLNSSKSHLRQTTSKLAPKAETIAEIKKSDVWKIENEFYEFALQQFHFTLKAQNKIRIQGKNLTQKFFYEKIRPKFWKFKSNESMDLDKPFNMRQKLIKPITIRRQEYSNFTKMNACT